MRSNHPTENRFNVDTGVPPEVSRDAKRLPSEATCVASGSGIRVYRFNTGPFCWYVIEESGRLALVDAGFPGHYRAFRRGIAHLGFEVRDVVGIVLTHAHSDHTGFAARVSREAGAPIFVHSKDANMAQRILQLPWLTLLGNAWRPWGSGILLHATLNGIFTCPRIRQVETITDAQEIDIPGRPVVIHTPGHTPGHVSLHVRSASALFAGDAVLTQSLRTGRSQQPMAPEKPYNMDDREARRSVTRLRGLDTVTILPGHGCSWTGDASKLESGLVAS